MAGQAQEAPQLGQTTIDEVTRAMTTDEKVNLIIGFGSTFTTNYSAAIGNSGDLVPGAAGQTNAIPRLGIPATVLADGPAGLRINATRRDDQRTYYCTHFPVETLLGCTWNRELVEQVGRAMGDEVRRYGVDVVLAPAANIQRNPLCGRNFEYYSEDPLLSGEMAAAMISGLQQNGIGTSLKHFVANNQETNRTGSNSIVDERTLREIYLKPFEIAIRKSRPWTVMTSYNKLNGTYTAESEELLTDLLRREWGYEGLVTSDWYGGRNFPQMVLAGNDMIQPGHPMQVKAVKAAIEQGTLPMEAVDRNVRRILQYIMKTPRYQGYKATNDPDLKAHAEVAREAAAEGMVLLKNEKLEMRNEKWAAPTLPLRTSSSIALFGRTSYDFLAGGTGSGNVNHAYVVSLTEALKNAGLTINPTLADSYTRYLAEKKGEQKEDGFLGTVTLMPEMPLTAEQARQAAERNAVAIVTIGKSAGEGRDRTHDEYYLTDGERQMIETVCTAFHKAKKPVVVILNIPGVIETASWKHLPDAILLAWMGGQEGAAAVVDVLTGKVSPSGRLTQTWPVDYADIPSSKTFPDVDCLTADDYAKFLRHLPVDTVGRSTGIYDSYYNEGIYVGYRHFDTSGQAVSYPFGYGLSYTTFEMRNEKAETRGDSIVVSVTVKNTGKMAGKEVVQLYVSAPGKDMDKPTKELRAFEKTSTLQPGESETVSLQVAKRDLSSYDTTRHAWVLESGTYQLHIAANSQDVRSTLPVTIEGRLTEQCLPILQR